MREQLNYISDEELEQLICQVEQEELVAAPPDLMEEILAAAGVTEKEQETPQIVEVKTPVSRKKEFYAYCFRVITSVAAAVVLVFLLPELSDWMERNGTLSQEHFEKNAAVQMIPSFEEVADTVPAREEVVASKNTPTREEVLNPAGFWDKVINGTGWFGKDSGRN